MGSDVQSISNMGRSPAPIGPPVSSGGQVAAAPVVATPKVSAPKPMETNYDANKLRSSMQEVLNMLNEQVSSGKQGLGFSFDQVSQRTVVTVRNTHSGEVVRQIPSEDFMTLSHKIADMKGLLYNNKT